jgi:hypothetical protein
MKYVRTPPGFPSVAEALRAGLLRVIISFGAGAVPDKTDACNVYFHLEELLCGTIPGALVYCGVVTQIKESVTEIIITPAFKRSPLFQAWDNLVSLVEKRVAVFDTWNAVGRVSSRACDNMEVRFFVLFLFNFQGHPSVAPLTARINSSGALTAKALNIARASARLPTGRTVIASRVRSSHPFDAVILRVNRQCPYL